MKVFDISIDLTNDLPHWPGEKGFSIQKSHRGDVCVSEISMGLHCGTHLDAPSHFLPAGKQLEQIALDRFMGMARVVALPDVARIEAEHLQALDWQGVQKVLFRTRNSSRDWRLDAFDESFVGLAPAGAQFLVEQGIDLVGIDYLSIEPFGSDGTVHNILLGKELVILEGLVLGDVSPGDYFLVAAPLKMPGAEASPTRAMLFSTAPGPSGAAA